MDRKVIMGWYDKKDQFKESTHKSKRFKLECTTAIGHFPQMEEQFEKWIIG